MEGLCLIWAEVQVRGAPMLDRRQVREAALQPEASCSAYLCLCCRLYCLCTALEAKQHVMCHAPSPALKL